MPRPKHLEELRRSIAALHKGSYIKSLEATVAQVDLGDITAIRAPAHFIVGAEDPLTPPAMHHEMAAKLGGAPVSVLPRAGHLSNIENPRAFNQTALAWLAGLPGLGRAPSRTSRPIARPPAEGAGPTCADECLDRLQCPTYNRGRSFAAFTDFR